MDHKRPHVAATGPEDESRIPLDERVADLLAGELSEDSARELEQHLGEQPALQAEESFWRAVRAALPAAAHPTAVHPPGPGLAAVIRDRMATDGATTTVRHPTATVRMLRWSPWLVTAAALVMATVLVLTQRSLAMEGQVFDEFGAAMSGVDDPLSQPRLQRVVYTPPADDGGEFPLADHPEDRVWMGIWMSPIALEGFQRSRGLLVTRVVADGPAARAGLRARDVILAVDTMATATRWCIPAALAAHQPDQEITVTYWREGFAEPRQAQLTLGRCWE